MHTRTHKHPITNKQTTRNKQQERTNLSQLIRKAFSLWRTHRCIKFECKKHQTHIYIITYTHTHIYTNIVGDSLHHDIIGAANSQIDSIFIMNGVHAEELGLVDSINVSSNTNTNGDNEYGNLNKLFSVHDNIVPTISMPRFNW